MARKSSRAHSRAKKHHSRKHKSRRHHRQRHVTRRRRTYRKRGGEMALRGAPVTYSLAGDWSSRMSLGQGDDFFKYHEGQHGGEAPVSSIGAMLPAELRGPAHISGIDKAIMDVRGLQDGGKRRRHRKSHRKGKKSHKKSHRRRRTHRKRGGALGYAPVSAPGMLLSSSEYSKAGLNPEWKTDVAYDMAKIRNTQ